MRSSQREVALSLPETPRSSRVRACIVSTDTALLTFSLHVAEHLLVDYQLKVYTQAIGNLTYDLKTNICPVPNCRDRMTKTADFRSRSESTRVRVSNSRLTTRVYMWLAWSSLHPSCPPKALTGPKQTRRHNVSEPNDTAHLQRHGGVRLAGVQDSHVRVCRGAQDRA